MFSPLKIALEAVLVREEAKDLVENYKKPVMKMLGLDIGALRKLAMTVAESDKAAVCLVNKSGNLVCAAGKDSGVSAKAMLDKILAKLGGSGGGSDRIAQGRVKKPAVVDL